MRMANYIDKALGKILFKEKQKPAPINKQHEWKNMGLQQRAKARMRWRDSDGDGVPDRWDCSPRNPFRQDTNTAQGTDQALGKPPDAQKSNGGQNPICPKCGSKNTGIEQGHIACNNCGKYSKFR